MISSTRNGVHDIDNTYLFQYFYDTFIHMKYLLVMNSHTNTKQLVFKTINKNLTKTNILFNV